MPRVFMTVPCCLLQWQFLEPKSRLENCYYFIGNVIRFLWIYMQFIHTYIGLRWWEAMITKLRKRFLFIFINSSVYDFTAYTY